jgi:hypothetical protein
MNVRESPSADCAEGMHRGGAENAEEKSKCPKIQTSKLGALSVSAVKGKKSVNGVNEKSIKSAQSVDGFFP